MSCLRQSFHILHTRWMYMYIGCDSYVSCLCSLQRDIDEKDKEIERLKKELEKARKLGEVSVMARNPSPQNSPPQFRPHSIHVDSSSLSQPADMDRINPDLAQEFLTADAGT